MTNESGFDRRFHELEPGFMAGDEEASAELYRLIEETFTPMAFTRQRTFLNIYTDDIIQTAFINLFKHMNKTKTHINNPHHYVQGVVINSANELYQAARRKSNGIPFSVLAKKDPDKSEILNDIDSDRPPISDFRANGIHGLPERNEYYLEQIFANEEQKRLIDTIIEETAKITPLSKRVLRMYYFDGLTTKRIAEELKLNENTVKSNKIRGEQRLKGRLALREDGKELLALIDAVEFMHRHAHHTNVQHVTFEDPEKEVLQGLIAKADLTDKQKGALRLFYIDRLGGAELHTKHGVSESLLVKSRRRIMPTLERELADKQDIWKKVQALENGHAKNKQKANSEEGRG